jgi:hypothetical protein
MVKPHSNLSDAIKNLHGCDATWLESVPVKETFQGQTVWEGVVEVFELIDHPTAKKCYAWSYLMDESGKRKFMAVLHQRPVDSPEKAVRAYIVADNKIRKTK